MNYAIIISNDPAGRNIERFLTNLPDNVKIHHSNKKCIYTENIDEKVDADYFIFPTTHKSEKGMKSLTVHNVGNFSKAELGGKNKTLVPASANLTRALFEELNKQGKDLDYEITLEVTHHGPFSKKPITFIEIGISEKEWNDPKAGEVIAKTIRNVLTKEIPKHKIGIGIGGPHYAPNFNNILNTNLAIAHICPTYNLQNLDKEMIRQMIEKTTEKVEFVLLDWKGLKKEKQRIKSILEEIKIPIIKIKKENYILKNILSNKYKT